MLERIWGKRNPHILLLEMQISTTTVDNIMEAPNQTKKYKCHMVQKYHSQGYTPKNVSQVIGKAPTHPFLLQHYSQ
jgi:hypothetical protein